MPGFFDPWWLLGLALVPFIRWLHRWQAPLSVWDVSAIFLWRQSERTAAAGRVKQRPEPAWRRRAFISALLVFALAQPYWQNEAQRLTVWIDDSLSSQSVENGTTRLEAMFEALDAELSGGDWSFDEIELRSLSDPGRMRLLRGSDSLATQDWPVIAESALPGPPAPLMSQESPHWLLSDGASETVRSWVGRVPVRRVLQSGSATENSAVVNLAVRRSIESPEQLDVLVAVSNRGIANDSRTVTLHKGDNLQSTTDIDLAPGQTSHWQTRINAGGTILTASLSAGDVLARDDVLSVSLDAFVPLSATVQPECGAALRRAVAMHPGLAMVPATDSPEVLVSCPRDRFPPPATGGAGGHIRVLRAAAAGMESVPTWSGSYGENLHLLPQWLAAAPWPEPVDAARDGILFGLPEFPLVLLRGQENFRTAGNGEARIVDTVLDLDEPLFVREPEYAAFVGVLADLATGRDLLNAFARESREPQNSNVAPLALPGLAENTRAWSSDAPLPLSQLLLLAALALLILETILFFRVRQGARHA